MSYQLLSAELPLTEHSPEVAVVQLHSDGVAGSPPDEPSPALGGD